tara:strand:+ start:1354 stop:2835 length:1482 start_codon:yes stop_codon:yes gene_type:complete
MEHDSIHIKPYDDVYIKVDCERGVAKELSDFFTFKVPNYQYTPAFKNKAWDGQIRLYNIYKQTIYKGLLDYILKFAEDRDYKVTSSLDIQDYNFTKDGIKSFIETHLNIPYSPYEHQIDAVHHAINNDRCLLLSPTGSGKSLIIYSLMRYYSDKINDDKKILIIVPTTGLVSQMISDFKDYSKDTKWNAGKNCHAIFSGQDKSTDKKIVISTWQSIHNMNEKYFDQFEAVFGDECHLFKAKSLTKIMSKLKKCPYRFGTTGTLDDSQTHKLVIEGLFGRVFKVTTTKQLMEENLLSELKIDCITLSYSDEEVQEIKRAKYIEEIKWLIASEKRNKFIQNLASNVEGNTLLLFNYVKEHGVPLYENLKKKHKDKPIFMIHGGTSVEQREEIRNIVDKEKNAILVASYGTCSTGINIKNIHNIIFASPSRSVIRVLQSIGRGLRTSKTKNKVRLYDISDDLKYLKYVNHTYKHLHERIKIYNKERFDFKRISIKL